VAAIALGVLVLRLWHLQFVRGAELREDARANRFAEREVAADRGVIYDRDGKQVVFNRPQFTVSIVQAALPEDAAEQRRVLTRVAKALDLPLSASDPAPEAATALAPGPPPGLGAEPVTVEQTALEDFLTRDAATGQLVRTWSAAPIPKALPRLVAFDLMEDALDLPGVVVGEASVREYRSGPTLAHILGFTGNIPADAIDDYRADGYRIYDVIGRTGIEHTYEPYLRGSKGKRVVKVDAMGRTLGEVSLDDPIEPVPGNALHLTLSAAFQEQVEKALQRGLARIGARSGAVVALDPRDGAVRALVSWPTFDNNMFSTGASMEDYRALIANPDLPLINRVISGQYAPGSTYKMITASAALQEGVIDETTRIVDPGIIYIPNQYDASVRYPFYCWLRGGHGSLNVVGAIAHSCDTFFYEISGGNAPGRGEITGLGSERLGRYARLFGLGAETEIDLLGEAAGRVPTPAWVEEWFGVFWGTGQTYITGIGQGYTLATPLQLANVAAAVANGGTLYRPHLVEEVRDAEGRRVPVRLPDHSIADRPGGVLRQIPVEPRYLALVRSGMAAAVRSGTAQSAWTRLPTEVAVAGKTGTAEFCDVARLADGSVDCRRDREGNLLTHAWFVAFAPVEQPEIALAVFVDGSGLDRLIEGSRDAAPIAADVLRSYFKLPERLPPTPSPTPCEGCPTHAPADPALATPNGPVQDVRP